MQKLFDAIPTIVAIILLLTVLSTLWDLGWKLYREKVVSFLNGEKEAEQKEIELLQTKVGELDAITTKYVAVLSDGIEALRSSIRNTHNEIDKTNYAVNSEIQAVLSQVERLEQAHDESTKQTDAEIAELKTSVIMVQNPSLDYISLLEKNMKEYKLIGLIADIHAGLQAMQKYAVYAPAISSYYCNLLKWVCIPLNPYTAYLVITKIMPEITEEQLRLLNFEMNTVKNPTLIDETLMLNKTEWLNLLKEDLKTTKLSHKAITGSLIKKIVGWFNQGSMVANDPRIFRGINRKHPLESMLDYHIRVFSEVNHRTRDFMDAVVSFESGFEIMGLSLDEEVFSQMPKKSIIPASLRLPSEN